MSEGLGEYFRVDIESKPRFSVSLILIESQRETVAKRQELFGFIIISRRCLQMNDITLNFPVFLELSLLVISLLN